MPQPHAEQTFEAEIVGHLTTSGGWQEVHASEYNQQKALLPSELVGFIRKTQPSKWKHWEQVHGEGLEDRILREVAKKCSQRGSLNVIRRGFRFSGRKLRLAFFRPATGLNPNLQAKYNANRLAVVRQVRYDPASEDSLDLGLFLNGIPVMRRSSRRRPGRRDATPSNNAVNYSVGTLQHVNSVAKEQHESVQDEVF